MTVGEEILRKARIQALEQDTWLNDVVREFLEQYTGGQDQYAVVAARLVAKSKESDRY